MSNAYSMASAKSASASESAPRSFEKGRIERDTLFGTSSRSRMTRRISLGTSRVAGGSCEELLSPTRRYRAPASRAVTPSLALASPSRKVRPRAGTRALRGPPSESMTRSMFRWPLAGDAPRASLKPWKPGDSTDLAVSSSWPKTCSSQPECPQIRGEGQRLCLPGTTKGAPAMFDVHLTIAMAATKRSGPTNSVKRIASVPWLSKSRTTGSPSVARYFSRTAATTLSSSSVAST